MTSTRELFSDERAEESWHQNPRLHARIKDFWIPPASLGGQLPYFREADLYTVKFGTGLCVARFSPIHFGHIAAIMYDLMVCDSIIIGIGSANKLNAKNPFPIDLREKWLREALDEFELTSKVTQIVRLDDFGDDQKWYENIMQVTDPFDVVLSSNIEEVNRVFLERNIPTLTVPEVERSSLQATKIREILVEERHIPQII
jgi:nicotinamide mononucleotide adenylyltransferase